MLKKSHVALGLAAVLLSSLATTVFLIGDQTIRKKNLFSMPKPKQVEYEKWTDHDVLVVYKHGASRNSIGISWGEGFDLDFQFKLRDALEKKKLGWKIIKLKGAKGLYESLMFDHVPGFVIFIVHSEECGFCGHIQRQHRGCRLFRIIIGYDFICA